MLSPSCAGRVLSCDGPFAFFLYTAQQEGDGNSAMPSSVQRLKSLGNLQQKDKQENLQEDDPVDSTKIKPVAYGIEGFGYNMEVNESRNNESRNSDIEQSKEHERSNTRRYRYWIGLAGSAICSASEGKTKSAARLDRQGSARQDKTR
jgi:hypothetical protein